MLCDADSAGRPARVVDGAVLARKVRKGSNSGMESDLEVCTLPQQAAPRDDIFDRAFKTVIDNFFEDRRPQFCLSERAWAPATDIFETADAIQIKIELAGVREEDVEVKVSDNMLVVRGLRRDELNVKKENFHLMEVQYGVFERAFGLPDHMEVKNISARLKNGFLLITIPKDSRLREYRIRIG